MINSGFGIHIDLKIDPIKSEGLDAKSGMKRSSGRPRRGYIRRMWSLAAIERSWCFCLACEVMVL